MSWSDFLSSLLGNTQSNRAAEVANIARANQARQLQDEYAQASADPNSGVGLSPAQQMAQEQDLANHIRSQMSHAGAGRSGAANEAVTKGIVDFRIAQMAQHQKHLDGLRQAMLTGSTPQNVQPTVPQQMVGGFAGRAGQGVASDLFGSGSEDEQTKGGFNVRTPVAQPNGYDPRGRSASGYPNGGDRGTDTGGV